MITQEHITRPKGAVLWAALLVPPILLGLVPSQSALAQFEVDWYTIDGGGDMWTTGGDFELSGTIGQPDASTTVMTGGNFELTGGFWPVPIVCRGDMNCDGQIDFGDINDFVLALANWPGWLATYPDCPPENADINGDGMYGGPNGFGDINPFVALLNSAPLPIPCP